MVSAAMAVPDNDFGGAGPAGPVAAPILVNTVPDPYLPEGSNRTQLVGGGHQ